MRHTRLGARVERPAAPDERVGPPHSTEAPREDETVASHLLAEQAVLAPAARKAHAVKNRNPGTWAPGADPLVVEVGGEILTQPVERNDARRQLGRLLGRMHDIHIGVCLVGPDGHITEAVERARLTFYRASPDELERTWTWRSGESSSVRTSARGGQLGEDFRVRRTGLVRLVRLEAGGGDDGVPAPAKAAGDGRQVVLA